MEKDRFIIRELEELDYDRGFLSLLSQLSDTIEYDKNKFLETMKSSIAKTFILEDTDTKKIVGTCSIMIEKKFVHQFKSVAHVEDVVTDKSCRGKGLGSKMVRFLLDYARKNNCYKLILDCSEENVKFYTFCGLKANSIQMAKYFELCK